MNYQVTLWLSADVRVLVEVETRSEVDSEIVTQALEQFSSVDLVEFEEIIWKRTFIKELANK